MLSAFIIIMISAFSQSVSYDTVAIEKGQILVFNDTVIVSDSDSILLIEKGRTYEIRQNDYNRSQAFYDSLKVKASKHRWSKELYNATINSQNKAPARDIVNIVGTDEYEAYNGLIVQEIRYKSVAMFGGLVSDTSLTSDNAFANSLNYSHINTLEKILRKNTVLKAGDELSANRLAENERFLRSLNFIKDARIIVEPIDSVSANLIVVTKDVFPYALGGGFSSFEKFEVEVSHNNLFGSGHGFRYRSMVNTDYAPALGHRLEYVSNNFFGTMATAHFRYQVNEVYTNWYGRITQEFITPESKYAYGLKFDFTRDSIALNYKDTAVRFGFKRDVESVWAGRNFLLDGKERRNLVFAAKYERSFYQVRPFINQDTNQYFTNSQAVLLNTTFLKSRGFKTSYLTGFGRTEDVLEGVLLAGTYGYYWSDLSNLYYGGVKLGYGHAFKKGAYFASLIEAGGFYKNKLQYASVMWNNLYYSELMSLGSSKLRLIARFKYKHGYNRFPFEWVSLGDDINGIPGDKTLGKSKTSLSLESILFTSADIFGFKLAPYNFIQTGLVRQEGWKFFDGNPYTGIGFGLRMRNENLVFQTFDLSFIFYPMRPNESKSFKFIFDDREPSVFKGLYIGEPSTVLY